MPTILRFHEVGGPEVLRFEEEPRKQPGKGEVQLKVHATGLNRAELNFIRGQYVEPPKLPAGVRYEAAGRRLPGWPNDHARGSCIEYA
jgi:NADPH:quinone reductase-like Zn-dependent oxidoreductase